MKIVIEAKDVTVSYRHYESATRSIKLNLLMNHKSQKQERFAIQNLSIQISSGEIIGVIVWNHKLALWP